MNLTRIAFLVLAAGLVLAVAYPVSAGCGCNGNLPSSTLSSSVSSTQSSWMSYKAALGSEGSALTTKMAKTEFRQVTGKVAGKTKYKSIR